MTTLPERLQDVIAEMQSYVEQEYEPDLDKVAEWLARLEAALALQPSVGGEVGVTEVSLCPQHGIYAKKGCSACDADIDMLTRIEPPDLASPATPSDGFKPGDRVLWTDSSGMYASAVGVVRERSNPAPVRYWIDFPDGSVASAALAHELTAAPSAPRGLGEG